MSSYKLCTPPQPKILHLPASEVFPELWPATRVEKPAEWPSDACLVRDNMVGSYRWEIAGLFPCEC